MKRIVFLLMTCLVALDAAGQTLAWAKSIGGTGTDQGHDIAVGGTGDVYSTGFFNGPVDFDPGAGTSTLPWGGGPSIYISKLTAAGDFVWAKQLGTGVSHGHYGIALDTAENIYLAGVYTGSGDFDPGPGTFTLLGAGGTSSFIAKYDSAGNFVWAKSISGTTGGGTFCWDIALDGAGNVYTAGKFDGPVDFDPGAGTYSMTPWGGVVGMGDGYICKLDAQGNFVWARRIGTPDDEGLYALTVDDVGNSYAIGSCWIGMGSQYAGLLDIFVTKLDVNGTNVWIKSFGSAGVDFGYDIALDATGNVMITGEFEGTADFDPNAGIANLVSAGGYDGFVLQLSPSGNFVWARQVGGGSGDRCGPVKVDVDGSRYILGSFQDTCDFDPGPGVISMNESGGDAYLLRLDANGGLVSVVQFGGSMPYSNRFRLAVDGLGSIYSTGHFYEIDDLDPGPATYYLTSASSGYADIFIQKLNACILPAAPSNTTPQSNLLICAGAATTLSASGSDSLIWYDAPSGGSVVGTGNTYVTPVLSYNTTFYVQQDNACGLGQFTAITVSVHQPSNTSLVATACDSYLSPSGNQTWTSSGNYVETLVDQFGCDSVVSVSLTILSHSAATISATACHSYTSPSGLVWTSSGTYMDTIPNVAGCDSIMSIQLTIAGDSTSTIAPIACGEYTSPSGAYVWTSSGIYMDTIPTAAGCDSVITINLTIPVVNVGINVSGSTLSASASGAAYQWIDCGNGYAPISGATQQSFSPATSGNYAVIVTENGCSDTSDCKTVLVVGNADPLQQRIVVLPNPAVSHLVVVVPAGMESAQFQVSDLSGKVVAHGNLTGLRTEISVAALAAGVYHLHVLGQPPLRFTKID